MNPKPLRYAISEGKGYAGGPQARQAALSQQAAMSHQAARLAEEGVDFFQLREKDLSPAALAALAHSLLRTLGPSGTKLLINSRADVALATSAHGVHLTAHPDELTPRQIHELYAQAGLPPPVVTLSCHTLEDLVYHREEPLAAILFGPIFEKSIFGTRRTEGIGLDLLRQAVVAAAPVPVLALGGITAENTAACLQAGAAGIAGIRLFLRL